MKRFTATEKWGLEWYRTLKPRLKCLWQFFCDNCDHAGVICPDFGLASFQIGEKVGPDDLKEFEHRVVKLLDRKYLIPSFIEFQYGTLSDACPAHKPVFASLRKHGLEYPFHTLPDRVDDTLQDRIGDEDKDKGTAKGSNRVSDTLPTSPEAMALADLFNRRHTTHWSEGEIKTFKLLLKKGLLTPEHLDVLKDYYEAERAKPNETGRHRRDLATLLNNFQGELDRAMNSKPTKNAQPSYIPSPEEVYGNME
jgi:hypothetical protein